MSMQKRKEQSDTEEFLGVERTVVVQKLLSNAHSLKSIASVPVRSSCFLGRLPPVMKKHRQTSSSRSCEQSRAWRSRGVRPPGNRAKLKAVLPRKSSRSYSTHYISYAMNNSKLAFHEFAKAGFVRPRPSSSSVNPGQRSQHESL